MPLFEPNYMVDYDKNEAKNPNRLYRSDINRPRGRYRTK